MQVLSPLNPQHGFIPRRVPIPIALRGRTSIQICDSKYEANVFLADFNAFRHRLKTASDDRVFNPYEGGLGFSYPVVLARISEKRNAQGEKCLVVNTYIYDMSDGKLLGWIESPYERLSRETRAELQEAFDRWQMRSGRDRITEFTCVISAASFLADLQQLSSTQTRNCIQEGSRHGRPDSFFQWQGCNNFVMIGEALGSPEYIYFDPDFPDFYAAKRNEFMGILADIGIAVVNTRIVGMKDQAAIFFKFSNFYQNFLT